MPTHREPPQLTTRCAPWAARHHPHFCQFSANGGVGSAPAPGAAVTANWTARANGNHVPTVLGPEVHDRGGLGRALAVGSGEGPLASSSSWGLQASSLDLWPHPSHVCLPLTRLAPLYVCVSHLAFLRGTLVIGFRATFIRDELISRPFFQMRSHSQVLGGTAQHNDHPVPRPLPLLTLPGPSPLLAQTLSRHKIPTMLPQSLPGEGWISKLPLSEKCT